MQFIKLTEHNRYEPAGIGRTVHVRVDSIDWITDVDEPEGDSYTRVMHAGDLLLVIETPEEILEQISKQEAFEEEHPLSEWYKIRAERIKRIEEANVSEAAKAFYRKWYSEQYTSTGGWKDDYDLIKELDEAGLVMTRLVFLEL